MKLVKCLVLLAAGLLAATLNSPCAFSVENAFKAKAPILDPEVLQSTEDLTTMKDRHFVRVLVSYSRTNYFLDGQANERGFEHELFKQYEKFLNKDLKRGGLMTFIIFIPVPFNRLISELLDGHGDIIASLCFGQFEGLLYKNSVRFFTQIFICIASPNGGEINRVGRCPDSGDLMVSRGRWQRVNAAKNREKRPTKDQRTIFTRRDWKKTHKCIPILDKQKNNLK